MFPPCYEAAKGTARGVFRWLVVSYPIYAVELVAFRAREESH